MASEAVGAARPAGRIERQPLYSEEAERGVLGSLLLDAGRVIDFCIIRLPTAEHFYLAAHQVIYETLQKMEQDRVPVDILTMAERLKMAGKLDETGGIDYLNQLLASTPTAAHAEYYIEIVRQKKILRAIVAKAREAESLCYTSDEPADELLGRTEQSFFEIAEQRSDEIVPFDTAVKQGMATIETIYKSKAGISGIPSGFRDIDNILLGLHRTDMIVLAARPSMGKTSLAMNIAENVALGRTLDHQPRAVAVFSLEMSREQLVMRMLCSVAEVPSYKIHKGTISNVDHGRLIDAAHKLSKAQLFVDDTAGMDIIELRARARRLKKRHNIELFVIDYMQLLHCRSAARDGRQNEVATISRGIKAMAKELNAPVMVLSQLNRAPDQRDSGEPKLSDLRESGSIEQDADVVCMLYRPGKYNDSGDDSQTILHVAKQRNGPVGKIDLVFRGDITRFMDKAPDYLKNESEGASARETEE